MPMLSSVSAPNLVLKTSSSSPEVTVTPSIHQGIFKKDEWQVVQRSNRVGTSHSPPRADPISTTLHPVNLPSSPSRFDVLSEIREEGEIDDEEENGLPLSDPKKRSKIQSKGKLNKLGKKKLVKSKDIALAIAPSSNPKKASSRKH